MRFLHLADVHLDTLFAGRSPALRERLRGALQQAWTRAVDQAVEEEVDALLIAGDLFDGERLSFHTERFLGEELARLGEKGIPVFYATGNHDPGEGTAERGRIEWPDHVTVFDDATPRTVDVRRNGEVVGRITGSGHRTAVVTEDLSRRFPRPAEDGVPAVALLHTQVGGARGEDAHDPYAPSELKHLERAGYDYWAIGHVHQRQKLSSVPGIHYPGNLQGRHPRENGAKGGLLVHVPGRGATPDVRFVDLAPVRWARIQVEPGPEVARFDGLVRAVRDAWRRLLEDEPARPGTEWVLRVELAGPSPLHRELTRADEVETLRSELTSDLGVLEGDLRCGEVRPAVDPAPYLERQDAAGEALRLVRAMSQGEEDPFEVLGIAPQDLGGAETEEASQVARYVRHLLDEGDRELLERFLQEREDG